MSRATVYSGDRQSAFAGARAGAGLAAAGGPVCLMSSRDKTAGRRLPTDWFAFDLDYGVSVDEQAAAVASRCSVALFDFLMANHPLEDFTIALSVLGVDVHAVSGSWAPDAEWRFPDGARLVSLDPFPLEDEDAEADAAAAVERARSAELDTITFTVFAAEILAGHVFRRADVPRKLREYKQRLLDLMCAEFGIPWRDGDLPDLSRPEDWDSPNFGRNPHGVPRVLETMTSYYAGLVGPMEGYYSYATVLGEEAVHSEHLPAIHRRTEVLRADWLHFFRDLLLVAWPEAAGKTTTWSRLRELGLGDRVFEEDFF